MPYIDAQDGTRLYYEEAGRGTPILFLHEFSGDHRSWEAQLRHFSRRYRCVAFNARGYPPSAVPAARSRYSLALAVSDAADVQRRLGMRRSHVVGCSMGAYTALQFGLRHPERAISVTTVGAGAGSDLAKRAQYLAGVEANARRYLEQGMPAAFRATGPSAGRIPQLVKDPRGFAEFVRIHESHSAQGLAHTQRGVQAKRPSIYTLGKALAAFRRPLLAVSGDWDDGSVGPALFLLQHCPGARLWISPGTGHTVNTEEPEQFNRVLGDFLHLVDTGRWRARDPRSRR